jgi:integrase
MPRTVIVTAEQREQMLTHASPMLRFVLTCCAFMGMRHGTARQFCPADIVPSVEGPRIQKRIKHQDVLDLPIPPRVLALIELAPQGGDPRVSFCRRFLGHKNGKSGVSPSVVAEQFLKLKRELSLPPALRIHDLRRTAALAVYEKTRSLYAVKELLGVRTLSAVLTYLALGKHGLSSEELEQLYERKS